MKVRWFDRPIVEELMRSRRRSYGHVLGMQDQIIPKQAMHWRPPGWRKAVRPKDTCLRTIEKEVREKDLNFKDIETRTYDRDAWDEFVTYLWTT